MNGQNSLPERGGHNKMRDIFSNQMNGNILTHQRHEENADNTRKIFRGHNLSAVFFLAAALAFIFFLLISGARASTIYVDDSGSDDTGDGSEGSPYATIQKGVDSTASQDTVHVGEGTYSEHITIDRPLTLEGEDGAIIDTGGSGVGVNITSDHVTVTGFTIKIGDKWDMRGVEVHDTQCNVSYNHFELITPVSSPGSPAIYVDSSAVFLVGNTADGVGYGLFANNSHQLQAKHNTFSNCGVDGMRIENSNTAKFLNNTVRAAQFNGIFLNHCTSANLSDNTLSNCRQNGILVEGGSGNSVFSNNAKNNSAYSGGYAGIKFEATEGGTLTSNDCSENEYGIYLYRSANVTLRKNSLHDNVYNFRAYGDYLYQFIHDIDTSNTVNGKAIYYLVNKNGESFNPSDAGYIVLVSAEGVTLRDIAMKGSEMEAIVFAYTHNCVLDNLNISSFKDGIYFRYTERTLLKNSEIHNIQRDGLFCRDVENTTIQNCRFYNTGDHGAYIVESTYSSILDSTFSNTSTGIYLKESAHISVRNNTITEQSTSGIYLSRSENSTIAGNTVFRVKGFLTSDGIELADSGRNSLTDNAVTECEGAGINLFRADYNTISKNFLSKNTVGIELNTFLSSPAEHNTITQNNIMDNKDYGLDNTLNDVEIKAENNYWGDSNGPTHSTNPEGKGDKVSDKVDFDPWLTEPVEGAGGSITRVTTPTWQKGESWTWTVTISGQSSEMTVRVLDTDVTKKNGTGAEFSCYEVELLTSGASLGRLYYDMNTLHLVNNSLVEKNIIYPDIYLGAIDFPFEADEDAGISDAGQVETPAGTFHAYKIETATSTIYYSPDVGNIVKIEGSTISAELKSYSEGGAETGNESSDEGFKLPVPMIYAAGAGGAVVVAIAAVFLLKRKKSRPGEEKKGKSMEAQTAQTGQPSQMPPNLLMPQGMQTPPSQGMQGGQSPQQPPQQMPQQTLPPTPPLPTQQTPPLPPPPASGMPGQIQAQQTAPPMPSPPSPGQPPLPPPSAPEFPQPPPGPGAEPPQVTTPPEFPSGQSQAPPQPPAQAPQPAAGVQTLPDGSWVCPQCGNRVEGKYIFCLNCGYRKSV